MHFKGHLLEHVRQMFERQEPHLSVETLPQQAPIEHSVLLELVEVRDPKLPFDAELRRDPDPALGDLPVRFVSPLRDPTDSILDGGPGTGDSVGRMGDFPVL